MIRRMRRALTIAVLAAATLVNVCSSGCTASGDEPKNKAAAPRDDQKGKAAPPREVRVTPAAERTLARTVSATGTLAADDQVVLGTKVAGRLAEITVDLGSRVRR